MGASFFEVTIVGQFKDMKEAFRAAQDAAELDCRLEGLVGEDLSYSGKINLNQWEEFVTTSGPKNMGETARKAFTLQMAKELNRYETAGYEMTGGAANWFKVRSRYKGKSNVKVFYFCGWARS